MKLKMQGMWHEIKAVLVAGDLVSVLYVEKQFDNASGDSLRVVTREVLATLDYCEFQERFKFDSEDGV